MAIVEAVCRLGLHDGRDLYRITLSGDKDWNGALRGIHVLGSKPARMNPGDQLWYCGVHAYWTPMLHGVASKLHQDIALDRHGYDFTVWPKKERRVWGG